MSSKDLIVDLTLLLLMILSISTWSIAIIKWLALRTEACNSREFLDKFGQSRSWQHRRACANGGVGDFSELAKAGNSICAELDGEEEVDLSDQVLREILESELIKTVQIISRGREKGLAELATIGSTAPFIGLFGTVWGIMNALKSITASGNANIDVVAGPIGEALIATAIGIATAVPAVLAYNYFLRRQRVHLSALNAFKEDYLRYALRNMKHWRRSC